MGDQPLFDPSRLPARDESGYTYHPDLDKFLDGDEDDEQVINQAMLRAAGFVDDYVSFEGDCEDEAMVTRYFEDGEGVVGWEPTKPDGDGWECVAIYDTENAPYAMFVRAVSIGEPA